MSFSSIKYLVKQGFKSLWFNRVNAFASLCVVTISLVMVGVSVLLSLNITEMIGSIESRNEVIVMITDGAPDNNVTVLGQKLSENENIFEVNFYSKEDAWVDMQEDMTEDEKALFQFIDENPLPDAYRVRVKDISELDETVSEISKLESVDLVKAPNDFASVLTTIRNVSALVFFVVTLALIVVCFVIISNTTRTSVYARRKEMYIMRYVGATKAFVEIPFFIEGFVIGVLSAAIAYGLTWFAYIKVYNMLAQDFSTWSIFGISGIIPWNDIALYTGLAYLAVGVVISAFGSVISTRKHLNV